MQLESPSDWQVEKEDYAEPDSCHACYSFKRLSGSVLRDSSICFDWDSVAQNWVPSNKTIGVYDQEGNKIETRVQYYTGWEWRNWFRTLYSYDSENRLILRWQENWNGAGWENYSSQTIYIYTHSNNASIVTIVDQTWGGTDWVNELKGVVTYNSNGERISNVRQQWDGGAWINFDQRFFFYNQAGNWTHYISEDWMTASGGFWENSGYVTYTYDLSGNKFTRLVQYWNKIDQAWKNSDKTEFTYDSLNYLKRTLHYNVGVTAPWDTSAQYIYTHDSDGNVTSELLQHWQDTAFVNYYGHTYEYDASGNQTSELYQFDWDGVKWIGQSKKTYTFDNNSNLENYLFELWNGTQWVFYYKCQYGFSKVTDVNAPGNSEQQPAVYPNPFNTYLNITLQNSGEETVTFELYNIYGQKVIKQKIPDNFVLPRNGLASGVYIYRIFSNQKLLQTGKLVAE